MRKASLAVALGALLVVSAAVGITGTRAARAAMPPNVKTVSVYRSMFSPNMMSAPSGVVVTLVNRDTIAHNIVLDRAYQPTSYSVTLAPGQRYKVDPLLCSSSCWSTTYTFRDADRSAVAPNGFCNSFCADIDVYYNGT
jgi:plastocyanin